MRKKRNLPVYVFGLSVCTLPPLAAVLSYFPVWKEAKDGSLVSGFALLLIILSAKPVFNHFKKFFKSPASYVLWLCIFIVFFVLSRIADEMTVISFVGFVSNLVGAMIFKIADRGLKRDGAER